MIVLYSKQLSINGERIESLARSAAATVGPAVQKVVESREMPQRPRVGPMGLSRFMPQQRQAPASVMQFAPAR